MVSAAREITRQMRRDVHKLRGVPALFLASADDLDPDDIVVRGPHNKRQMTVGELASGDGWAQREDVQPMLIFDRVELESKGLKLLRNMIISIEVGEAYYIETAKARDDEFITAYVVPLDEEECAGLPVPEGS